MTERRARDLELLDALDAQPRIPYEGEVWRVVREGRDVLQGAASGARWDPGTLDVLYTSLAREGALEEIHFHLTRQPVFPSKIRFVLYRVGVRTRRTLQLADMAALESLGVTADRYRGLEYQRTQEIGDAAAFLGFDGLLVPSVRWDCRNLVLFTDRLATEALTILSVAPVDWEAWRQERQRKSPGSRKRK